MAIYVGEGEDHAFVDAVNLPIPRAGRRSGRGLPWQRVRFSPLRMFRSYVDVLALRPPLPADRRKAAAEYARAQVGQPFHGSLIQGLLRRTAAARAAEDGPKEFTCSSLIWLAYLKQGFDLSSGPLRRLAVPWPSLLSHDRRLQRVGRGTRYRPFRPAPGQVWLYLARAWFRWALRSDVAWRGEPDGPVEPSAPPASVAPPAPADRAG